MKKLIVLLLSIISLQSFAKSNPAPDNLYDYKKIKTEKTADGDYLMVFEGQPEGLNLIKARAERLISMEALDKEININKNILTIKIKNSVDMDLIIKNLTEKIQ